MLSRHITDRRLGRTAMPKTQIRSDRLRQPSGVFSHATAIEAKGRLVFISGMTARRLDGAMAGVGDIEAQTRQVCENLKAAVEAAGGTMDDICRSMSISATWSSSRGSTKSGANTLRSRCR